MAARLIWPRAGKLCCCSVPKLYPTLGDVMGYGGVLEDSSPGSSVHGIFQARILKWIAVSFSWGTFFQTQGSNLSLPHWRVDSLWLSHLGSPEAWVQWQALNSRRQWQPVSRHWMLDTVIWSLSSTAVPDHVRTTPAPEEPYKAVPPTTILGKSCALECELPRLHSLIKE